MNLHTCPDGGYCQNEKLIEQLLETCEADEELIEQLLEACEAADNYLWSKADRSANCEGYNYVKALLYAAIVAARGK